MLESLRSIKDLMCVSRSSDHYESFMGRFIYLTLLLGSNRNNYNKVMIVKLTFPLKATFNMISNSVRFYVILYNRTLTYRYEIYQSRISLEIVKILIEHL